jgi:acylphosphatase
VLKEHYTGLGNDLRERFGALGESAGSVRRDVLYHGRVQGVGFRYTARHIAGRFRVTGFVQNLPDGRVRMVAEGAGAEVDRFVAAVAAEMAGYIHGQDDQTLPTTGEFCDFAVRR